MRLSNNFLAKYINPTSNMILKQTQAATISIHGLRPICIYISLLITCSILATANTHRPDKVLELTSDNYDEQTSKFQIVVLNFYADRYNQSARWKPVFQETALAIYNETQDVDPNTIVFGQINCELQTMLAQRFRITRFPTIKLTLMGKLCKKEYRGPRTAVAFKDYVKQYLIDPIVTVNDHAGLTTKVEERKGALILYSGRPDELAAGSKVVESVELQMFRQAARTLREDCQFIYVTSAASLNRVQPPDLYKLIFKPQNKAVGQDEIAYPSSLTDLATLSVWAKEHCVPLVREIPCETADEQTESSALVPRSERASILEVFNKFFIKARSHIDQAQKERVRDGVIRRLTELGFEEAFLQKSKFEFQRQPAISYNMIGIMPGMHRRTKHDRIVLVGAHWDSATKAPGVDDNGSGSTCLLEIARLIAKHKCRFNHTVMLVWFDYEEQGKYGSEFFVNDYLYPYELDRYGSKFIGAYILDMILVRDKENNTQTLPNSLRPKLGKFFDELEREKNRGDFLAAWSRRNWDEPLENAFRNSWQDLGNEARTFKAMRPELPQTRLPNAEEKYDWKDFFRSDHASFWYPPLTSTPVRRAPNRTSSANHASLNAILLTDLGPWRRSYAKCYHSPCDDEHLLTDGNLAFMQQVVDALVLTVLRTGQGECQSMTNPSSSSPTALRYGAKSPAPLHPTGASVLANMTTGVSDIVEVAPAAVEVVSTPPALATVPVGGKGGPV